MNRRSSVQCEPLHEFGVRRGHGHVGHLCRLEPSDFDVLQRFRLTIDVDGYEVDLVRAAGILAREERRTHGNELDREFFGDLAAGSGLHGLPGVELASWELPQAAVSLLVGALPNEVAAMGLCHDCDDRDHFWRVRQTASASEAALPSGTDTSSNMAAATAVTEPNANGAAGPNPFQLNAPSQSRPAKREAGRLTTPTAAA
jgi:hypothetical protein